MKGEWVLCMGPAVRWRIWLREVRELRLLIMREIFDGWVLGFTLKRTKCSIIWDVGVEDIFIVGRWVKGRRWGLSLREESERGVKVSIFGVVLDREDS